MAVRKAGDVFNKRARTIRKDLRTGSMEQLLEAIRPVVIGAVDSNSFVHLRVVATFKNGALVVDESRAWRVPFSLNADGKVIAGIPEEIDGSNLFEDGVDDDDQPGATGKDRQLAVAKRKALSTVAVLSREARTLISKRDSGAKLSGDEELRVIRLQKELSSAKMAYTLLANSKLGHVHVFGMR